MKKSITIFLALLLFFTSFLPVLQTPIAPQKAYAKENCIYYVYDGQGNIRFITDENGVKVRSTEYDPFGNWRAAKGQANIHMLYQGQQQDPESSFYYLRARYYDPFLGRFISKDPVRGYLNNPQSQNPYSYSLNNPINLSDPSGEDVYGICGSCNIGLGGYLGVSGCVGITDKGEIGLTGSKSWGALTGATIGGNVMGFYNNKANSISDLGGSSTVVGGSVKEIGGLSTEYQITPGTNPLQVESTALGPSLGFNFPPYYFYAGKDTVGTFSLTNFVNSLLK